MTEKEKKKRKNYESSPEGKLMAAIFGRPISYEEAHSPMKQ